LLWVIDGQESESEVGFSIPPESRPMRNELFYFKIFQNFDRTLLQVIGASSSNLRLVFLLPFRKERVLQFKNVAMFVVSIQSETSCFILRLSALLMKLCLRLSGAWNPNPNSDFSFELPIGYKPPHQKSGFSFFEDFGPFDETLL
jgi:hypothetical protein